MKFSQLAIGEKFKFFTGGSTCVKESATTYGARQWGPEHMGLPCDSLDQRVIAESGDIVYIGYAAEAYVRRFLAAGNASGVDEYNPFTKDSVRIGPAKGYPTLQAAIEGISRNDPREEL